MDDCQDRPQESLKAEFLQFCESIDVIWFHASNRVDESRLKYLLGDSSTDYTWCDSLTSFVNQLLSTNEKDPLRAYVRSKSLMFISDSLIEDGQLPLLTTLKPIGRAFKVKKDVQILADLVNIGRWIVSE